MSNKDWTSPSEPDAQITSMKDGRTHLAYKSEHVVDMESGLVLAAPVHLATAADCATLGESVLKTQQSVLAVGSKASIDPVAADKGYHKAEALAEVAAMPFAPITYVSEPKRITRRRGTDKPEAWKAAVQGTLGGLRVRSRSADACGVGADHRLFRSARAPARPGALTAGHPVASCAA